MNLKATEWQKQRTLLTFNYSGHTLILAVDRYSGEVLFIDTLLPGEREAQPEKVKTAVRALQEEILVMEMSRISPGREEVTDMLIARLEGILGPTGASDDRGIIRLVEHIMRVINTGISTGGASRLVRWLMNQFASYCPTEDAASLTGLDKVRIARDAHTFKDAVLSDLKEIEGCFMGKQHKLIAAVFLALKRFPRHCKFCCRVLATADEGRCPQGTACGDWQAIKAVPDLHYQLRRNGCLLYFLLTSCESAMTEHRSLATTCFADYSRIFGLAANETCDTFLSKLRLLGRANVSDMLRLPSSAHIGAYLQCLSADQEEPDHTSSELMQLMYKVLSAIPTGVRESESEIPVYWRDPSQTCKAFEFNPGIGRPAYPGEEISLFFHGSVLALWTTILATGGLKIKTGTDYEVNGSTYGRGIYLSDSIWKAQQYTMAGNSRILPAPVRPPVPSCFGSVSEGNSEIHCAIGFVAAQRDGTVQWMRKQVYKATSESSLRITHLFVLSPP